MASGSTHVALLRAVNVAGRTVSMAELRTEAEALGFGPARTCLNSGNLLVRAPGQRSTLLEGRLEEGIERRFGLRTDVLVRDAQAWGAMRRRNPFAAFARSDPSHLVVVFLKEEPPRARAGTFERGLPGPEEARVLGHHAFVSYPDGIGRSKLTLARIESGLGVRGTGRNWNTVEKLAELIAPGTSRPEREGG